MNNNDISNRWTEPYIGMPIDLSFDDVLNDNSIGEMSKEMQIDGQNQVMGEMRMPEEQPQVANYVNFSTANENMERAGNMTQNKENSKFRGECIDTYKVGMTYTPMQMWKSTYDLDFALRAGTIFPELNLPLRGYAYNGGGK